LVTKKNRHCNSFCDASFGWTATFKILHNHAVI
jgi:hypothetical protein